MTLDVKIKLKNIEQLFPIMTDCKKHIFNIFNIFPDNTSIYI